MTSVRVVAIDEPELGASVRCGSARLAAGSARSGHGVLLADGVTVVVARELVGTALSFGVRWSSDDFGRGARLRHLDAASGLAFLALDTAAPRSELSLSAAPTTARAVTLVRRRGDLGIDLVSATLEPQANGDLAIFSLGIAGGEAVFADGQFIGVSGGGTGTRRALLRPSIEAIPPEAEVDRGVSAALAAARTGLARLAFAADEAARCAAYTEVAAAEIPARDAQMTADDHVLLATLAWNVSTLSGTPPREPQASPAVEGHLDAARDAQRAEPPRSFAASVRTARVARDQAADRAARAEAAAREQAVRAEAARIRRRDRPLTYTAALIGSAARDGSTGYGATGLSLGLFATLPTLRAQGGFGVSAIAGASFLLGFGASPEYLATVDLGATMRLGGRTGTFLVASWSPGILGSQLSTGDVLALRSYRVGAGVAIHRTVVFGAFRGLQADGDYPLYLGELGVALRFGPHREEAAEAPDEAPSATATSQSPGALPSW